MPVAATRADALRVRFAGVRDVGDPKAVGAIPGTAVIAAAGLCGEGVAALASRNDGKDLCFRAPGSARFGDLVRCASDGEYLLEDGEDINKWARVSVRPAFLSPTPQQGRVFLQHQAGYMILDKSPGGTTSLTLSCVNRGPQILENVKVWSPTPNTTFNLGAGDTAAPDEASALLVGTLQPNVVRQLNMKLTIPGGTPGSPREFVDVRFTWDSF